VTIPVVSIVGTSNSGKTTLIEKLIAELKRRGYRVATIKHNRHGFEIDHEGKDSWRHRHAGAATTIVASPSQVAVMEDVDRDYSIVELVNIYIRKADIVLTEGFKGNPLPKIEVYRSELKRERLTGPNDNLIALAVDNRNNSDPDVPCFDRNDAVGIVDLIIERLIKRRQETNPTV
jgi:molybdopterin-guanine dinucleotide biosynthesis protein MobB